MKDGQEQQPLAKRLLKQQQALESSQIDLMASASQSFKTSLEATLSNANDTITAAIQDLITKTQNAVESATPSFQMEETKALDELKQAMDLSNAELRTSRRQSSIRNNWAILTIALGIGLFLGMGLTIQLRPAPQQPIIVQPPAAKPPTVETVKFKLLGQYMITDLKTGQTMNCKILPLLKESNCVKVKF